MIQTLIIKVVYPHDHDAACVKNLRSALPAAADGRPPHPRAAKGMHITCKDPESPCGKNLCPQ